MTRVKIFEPKSMPHDENTKQQLMTCAEAGDAVAAVLCADSHLGYSAPIGSAIAYRDYVSPSGVGFDISCGNKAVQTELTYQDIAHDLPHIMDEIKRRISFGIGRVNNEPVDHPVLDEIAKEFPTKETSGLASLAEKQLGTVGAGNHYVDIFEDQEDGKIWIGVHFGSRGFGHKIASGFLALAQGLKFEDRFQEGGMMEEPTLFHIDSEIGRTYLEAMWLAGDYAYAGRDVVVEKVLEILGHPAVTFEVHSHHNYQWQEEHQGEIVWVVRKGSTPLFPGQFGFVGATMGEDAYILEGQDTFTAEEALYSAPHGAGRAMSRNAAAGKWRRKWLNNVREDETIYDTKEEALAYPGATKTSRARVREGGAIDFKSVLERLKDMDIELRGGAADEAPGAYKRLGEVIVAHGDAVAIRHVLRPIGVAMADEKAHDPYRD